MLPDRSTSPSWPAAQDQTWNDIYNPARAVALAAGLVLVAVRFSELHQMTTHLTGVNFRLLYLFGLPALAGVVLSGGLRRTFEGRPAFYWTGYLAWMALAVPFSSWKGGSVAVVLAYVRTEYVMLLIIAGLVVTWRECIFLMYALATAAVLSVANGMLFRNAEQDRLAINFGKIANANDYSCYLLLMLPCVLWLALRPGSWAVTRAMAWVIVTAGVFLILSTGSRGAALGLVAATLFLLYRATTRQRIAILVLGPIMAAVAITSVPTEMLQRIKSIVGPAEAPIEAQESANLREYVFWKSVQYTFRHPVFGVGPGQFGNYEGQTERVVAGQRGRYLSTHNTFTQASSECGIPALIFFAAGLASSYRLLKTTYRKARERPDCHDIQSVAFCLMLGMVGFTIAMAFLNFAYFYFFPAWGGIAIAVSRAATSEFDRRAAAGGHPADPRFAAQNSPIGVADRRAHLPGGHLEAQA